MIISRAAAKMIGQKWYFTGKPCPHGHVAKRSVSSRDCRGCVDERCRRQRRVAPARLREKDRRGYWKNPGASRQHVRASRERHLEKRQAGQRASYRKNPGPAKERAKAWGKAHPEYLKYCVAKRRAAIACATPPWLSDEQQAEIRAIYASATRGTEVDHVIPLRGRGVCGLHVPWNLQHLPKSANRRKGNKHGH